MNLEVSVLVVQLVLSFSCVFVRGSGCYVSETAAKGTPNPGRRVLGSEFNPAPPPRPPTHPPALQPALKARQWRSRAERREDLLSQLNSDLTFSPQRWVLTCGMARREHATCRSVFWVYTGVVVRHLHVFLVLLYSALGHMVRGVVTAQRRTSPWSVEASDPPPSSSSPPVVRHQDVLEGSNLRAPLQELHQMIMTPIKAFSGGEEASLQRPLLSSEGKSVAPGSHLSGSGGGEAESGTSVIAEGDLPGQFTRVMGKGELHAGARRRSSERTTSFLCSNVAVSLLPAQFAPSCWCRGQTRTTSAPTYNSSTSALFMRYPPTLEATVHAGNRFCQMFSTDSYLNF